MFLDCQRWLDGDGAVRCGLPAEVRFRFILRSTGGPLECAMISCPSGHRFNGPIDSLTLCSPARACNPARGENPAAVASGGPR